MIATALALLLPLLAAPVDDLAPRDAQLAAALERAGENRAELEAALERVGQAERPSMAHLIRSMPEGDLRSLGAVFLVEHVTVAHRAWAAAPWSANMPEAVFLDYVLPYASINERRDAWRADFHERFAPLVADARTASEAAAILNREVFPLVAVRYSTQRPKADQSPYESMEGGLASCTGLSVLLIDACRAVGVPARFVGTPLWSDGSGNHSWVEVWDDGWHFTGAAEPTGEVLDKAWFTGRASTAVPGDMQHGIFAVSFRPTPLRFPMVWQPDADEVWCVDVTERYTRQPVVVPEGMARVRVRVLGAADETGQRERVAEQVSIKPADGEERIVETKDERFDANDHVEVVLPLGSGLHAHVGSADGLLCLPVVVSADEQLVTLRLDELEPSSGACGR